MVSLPVEQGKQLARVAASIAALGLPGVVFAQQAPPQQTPPPAQAPAQNPTLGGPQTLPPLPTAAPPTTTDLPIAPITPTHSVPATPQPAAATPPTPLPKTAPNSSITGVKLGDVKPTTMFDSKTPGQPLPSDPKMIRTLDEAISATFVRNPSILQAQERAFKTIKQVDQILALKHPTISGSATYSRLANESSAATAGSGVTPASISNPFGVGLSVATPGSTPIQLSTSGTTGGAGTTSAAGATNTTTVGSSAASTSSTSSTLASSSSGRATTVPLDNGAITRQTTGTGTTGTTTTTNNSFGGTNLNQASARVTLSQFIDITGVIKTAEQIGDLEEALSRIELARTRQQAAYDVKNAYYNLLRSQAFVSVNEAAVADSEELLRVTQVQEQAGVASRFDTLRAQTQLDNNRQALINSQNQVAIAKNALANVIGLDPSTPVDAQALPVPTLPTLDEEVLIQQAYKQRPEYLEADINLLVATKNIRLAHRTLEPYVNVGVTGAYNATASAATQDKATASVGVTLTYPLYDGGQTRAAVDAAKSDERGALIQKDQFARGIKAEVQQSIIAVKDANDRTQAIASTVVQAREALRLANVRFRAGVGTQLDVNDAQSALIQAESNQVSALFDYLGALARLSRSVGEPQ